MKLQMSIHRNNYMASIQNLNELNKHLYEYSYEHLDEHRDEDLYEFSYRVFQKKHYTLYF